MSLVYLARDTERDATVVIKCLKASAAKVRELRERFLIEARATMAVDHASVVRVFGVEEAEGGRPCIIMEALRGEPLNRFLDREGAMPQKLVVTLGRQIASALAATHRAGIIHRDVKPGNLFLTGPVGAPRGVKLIDFGFAALADDKDGVWGGSNLVLGTAQYMAPEQVTADPVDARTDEYAFGVVVFRMLTGQLPFDLDPCVDLFGHQLFSPAPPPSWLVDSLDPRLERVVLRCMQKHPKNRYPCMEAVIAGLDAIIEAEAQSEPRRAVGETRRVPDAYKPRNPRGRELAETLAQYVGVDPPAPPSSRWERRHGPTSG